MASAKYDVIIVGAGAGGGVIAGVLAEAGWRVLLLERGRSLSFKEVGRDHLRNQRLSQYGVNAGPEPGHVRVAGDQVIPPHNGGYHNNAATVGGGTRVYGGQAWRFHPLDFQMASTYGVPEGSSLADWPVTHAELAPFYARAERELGVTGDAAAMWHLPERQTAVSRQQTAVGTHAVRPVDEDALRASLQTNPLRPSDDVDYPMPPILLNEQGRTVRKGAAALGWRTLPIPLAINSVPHDGRPACIHCQHCVGFACPVDAKNGTQNTLIPRALVTGRCDLITDVMAERIEISEGRATGITYIRLATGERVTESAEIIVVAGGAIETARLLLLSGVENDNIGRNLQGHYYPGAAGLLPEPIWDGIGPGATTAMCEFNHGNDGVIGGGMLADDFIPLPATFWKGYTPPYLPRWGEEPKRWMRENHRRVLKIMGPVQDIPSPTARVTLDPDIRDSWGVPVVRLSGATHPETVRTAAFMFERAKEWLGACGATEIWGSPPPLGLSGGQHQAGTCRMGDDPKTSVADRHCRIHGIQSLYLGDGSVHVTNGGFNPFLTIMALAYRTAEHIRSVSGQQ